MNKFEILPYKILTNICSDKPDVLLVEDKHTSTQYILKSFPTQYAGRAQYEGEKLIRNLSHPHIINMKENHDHLQCVILEYAAHGNFCDLLMKGTVFPETVARTYFHHLLEGVDYLHKNGIAHLDLKFDNLLLGSQKSLKIIDFDFAQRIDDEKRNYARNKGTTNYRAEIRIKKCSNYRAADIYSMGVILFALVTGLPPYTETEKGEFDAWYHLLMKQPTNYWEKMKKLVHVSDELRELFLRMVCENPEKRLSIDDIRASNWFKGPILNAEELEVEMQKVLEQKN